MIHLGHTRTSLRHNHALLTPDTFIRAPLPGMKNGTAIVHAAPALGAAFTEYTAELDEGGMVPESTVQRFAYMLEGEIEVDGKVLAKDSYCYSPSAIQAKMRSRVAIIEREYKPLNEFPKPPEKLFGNERAVKSTPLMGDEALEVRVLLPDNPSFDFAVNTMTFAPGASLPMVESHVMEHGLLMLDGGGIYRLDENWYPVAAGDFIWMGPYCPQWFGAIGKTSARYLIYKDWNRHPL